MSIELSDAARRRGVPLMMLDSAFDVRRPFNGVGRDVSTSQIRAASPSYEVEAQLRFLLSVLAATLSRRIIRDLNVLAVSGDHGQDGAPRIGVQAKSMTSMTRRGPAIGVPSS